MPKNFDVHPNETVSVEVAFRELMRTQAGRDLAKTCYYEQDPVSACRRFAASEEWREVRGILEGFTIPPGSRALDLGAGNGIASYALAQLGFNVTSIEPDRSDLVGHGALRRMVKATNVPVQSICALGETIPIYSRTFSLVYSRQTLHHTSNLTTMLSEVARVLVPGGFFLACREHVIDDQETLNEFLNSHPLHRYTGSEGAFTLGEYKGAMRGSGLRLLDVIGPWDSVINHYPTTRLQLRQQMILGTKKRFGPFATLLAHYPLWEKLYRTWRSFKDRTPGRAYSFVCVRC